MSADQPRRPTAFRLDAVSVADGRTPPPTAPKAPVIVTEPDPFAALPDPVAVPLPPRRRRRPWSRLFFAAVGGLVSLSIGLAIDRLVRSLFDRTDVLGWIGLALIAIALVALVVLIGREIAGLLRLRRITHIQDMAATAIADDSRAKAREACTELVALYEARPETARGRTALSGHLREIIDGRDLMGLAETELLLPLDQAARQLVMSTARRVSVVTAISPRALVDVLFVMTQILTLIRRLGALYGGRPGVFGFLRLTRRAISHLAITGGMAAGESLIQQVVGHGLAARISARLGEGVINGILTARVGIAAIEVCRPLPFVFAKPTRLGDVVVELTRKAEKPDPSETAEAE